MIGIGYQGKRGQAVLRDPLLNRGTGFTRQERRMLHIDGLLPNRISTIEEQVARAHGILQRAAEPMDKYMALADLQERNETLFYRVLLDHLEELMPIIYTPTVGEATRHYSTVFRRGRGVWITPDHRGRIAEVLRNSTRDRSVRLAVVTDNEAILGIGDQGAGGMAISVGKLALYTAAAGIDPMATLPVSLDFGTDNAEVRMNPRYIGWNQPRLRGAAYDELVEEFVAAVCEVFPHVLVQWEDFRKDNALNILDRYRSRIASFNDDIQGTGAVALAGVLSAARVSGVPLKDTRIVIHGAGAAGLGIARQLRAGLMLEGLDEDSATGRIAVLDSRGLLVSDGPFRDAYKAELAWSPAQAASHGLDPASRGLQAVIEGFRPHVLIGTSGQGGAFTESVIRAMAERVERPVVLPFSNPTSNSEALPGDIIGWTDGRALVATGSPFDPVEHEGRTHVIGQGNNVFIFPGLGLGALLASECREVSDEMIHAAAMALAGCVSEDELARGLLFPATDRLREVAMRVAMAVIARAEGEANPDEARLRQLQTRVEAAMWVPRYKPLTAADI